MNALRLGVFSVALSSVVAAGGLRAADLVVTISPNPVEANATATITAVANGPTCPDAEFDFGDGTRAKATRAGTGFVAKHVWLAAGKHVVRVVAGPANPAGRVPCGPTVTGSSDATVRMPVVKIDLAVGQAGVTKGAVLSTPTPQTSGDGPGGLKAGAPPPKPLTIEFVPPSPAPNSLLVVKVSGLSYCDTAGINYGDGSYESAGNPKGGGGKVTFYHSYAKAGTYDVRATASSIGAVHCDPLPGTAKVTVQ